MDYAIVLYFDEAVAARFTAITRPLAESIPGAQIPPPHLTLAYGATDDMAPLAATLERHAAQFSAGELSWEALGMFMAGELFAAAVLNAYLDDFARRVHALLKPLPIRPNAHYLPYQWLPHTTLATDLTLPSLSQAFAVAAAHFQPFTGYARKLALVQCPPCHDLQSWPLA